MTPKNQHQLALWYLYNWNEFSLKDLINDSMFFKFQTRLSEIENRENTNLANREIKIFTNRFGRKTKYNVYSAINKEKIKKLFSKYDEYSKKVKQ